MAFAVMFEGCWHADVDDEVRIPIPSAPCCRRQYSASRLLHTAGHDSYAACFELFGVRPDYILVPGDVEAPPILIDTLNHGEGVVKIETVAT